MFTNRVVLSGIINRILYFDAIDSRKKDMLIMKVSNKNLINQRISVFDVLIIKSLHDFVKSFCKPMQYIYIEGHIESYSKYINDKKFTTVYVVADYISLDNGKQISLRHYVRESDLK